MADYALCAVNISAGCEGAAIIEDYDPALANIDQLGMRLHNDGLV